MVGRPPNVRTQVGPRYLSPGRLVDRLSQRDGNDLGFFGLPDGVLNDPAGTGEFPFGTQQGHRLLDGAANRGHDVPTGVFKERFLHDHHDAARSTRHVGPMTHRVNPVILYRFAVNDN